MKKILLAVAMVLSLSSCAMAPDEYTGQELIYGDKLIESREIPEFKRINSSFTYKDSYDDSLNYAK